MNIADGLHDLTDAEYNAVDRLRWSHLKLTERAPLLTRRALDGADRGDSDALKMGRAVDCAVFTPELMDARVVVWDGGVRKGAEWTAFKALHAGLDILTRSEIEEVEALAAAVRNDPHAARYLEDGTAQQSVLWTAADGEPVECKSKLDFLSARSVIADLKSARDASPGAFGRAAAQYGYHGQAAFYHEAVFAVTGERMPVVLIAVEKSEPYMVATYRVPEDVLEAGRVKYRNLLNLYRMCRETNIWPGYCLDSELTLTLPGWATNEVMEEA